MENVQVMLESLYQKITGQISWSACVEGMIGYNTKVWRWSHISEYAVVGDNCMIGEHVYIGPGVIIGNNCRIQNGCFIPEGVKIENNVFIGPHVHIMNDKYSPSPKSKLGTLLIESGAIIGGDTTIVMRNCEKMTIGTCSKIAAKSLILNSVDAQKSVKILW